MLQGSKPLVWGHNKLLQQLPRFSYKILNRLGPTLTFAGLAASM